MTTTHYQIGFAFSIVLTLLAFGLLEWHIRGGHLFPTHTQLVVAFVLLAVVQLFVQLIFFLHVGQEKKEHWNITALVFAGIVVGILVGGTLWIMTNLQHNMPQGTYINGIVTPQNEND